MSETNGNGKGTFWKVVQIVTLGVLAWVGSMLLVIPTHGYRLDAHEARLGTNEARINEVEKTQTDLKAARSETKELISLLREAKLLKVPPRHPK